MERQPSPYKANCVSSWKSTNLTGLVDDPAESVEPNSKPKKNAIKYNLAVRFNFIFLMRFRWCPFKLASIYILIFIIYLKSNVNGYASIVVLSWIANASIHCMWILMPWEMSDLPTSQDKLKHAIWLWEVCTKKVYYIIELKLLVKFIS